MDGHIIWKQGSQSHELQGPWESCCHLSKESERRVNKIPSALREECFTSINSPSLTMPTHQTPHKMVFPSLTLTNGKKQRNESSNRQNTLPMTLLPEQKRYFLKEERERKCQAWLTEVTSWCKEVQDSMNVRNRQDYVGKRRWMSTLLQGNKAWGGGIVNKRFPKKDMCV